VIFKPLVGKLGRAWTLLAPSSSAPRRSSDSELGADPLPTHSGILSDMQGAKGLAAWRWLFIIEGVRLSFISQRDARLTFPARLWLQALTIFFAFVAAIVLPSYPNTTMWLTEHERYIAEQRLKLIDDSLIEENEGVLAGLKAAVTDKLVWFLAGT
jgi:hypothetical protein